LESRAHRLLPRFGYFYFFPKPIGFSNGRKHYRILVPEYSQFSKFVEAVEERLGDMRLTYKSRILNPNELQVTLVDRILSKLSPKQNEALHMAYNSRYYECPRGNTLEKMARDVAIGKSTFQSHLRKAENKIIHFIMGLT